MWLTAQDYDHLEHSFIPRALAQAAGIYRVDSYDGHQRMDRGGTDYISGLIFHYYASGTTNTVLERLRVDCPSPGWIDDDRRGNEHRTPPQDVHPNYICY